MRALLLVLGGSLIGCGGEVTGPSGGVGQIWQHDAQHPVAPPGTGVDHRVLVMLATAIPGTGGRFFTLDDRSGNPVEQAVDGAALTEHAPVMSGDRVYALSTIGALVGFDLTGDVKVTVPPSTPSGTSPLALADDGSLRWGTAAGELVSVGTDGAVRFRATIGDPVTTALGFGADGRTYAAIDTGRVVGVDGAGAVVFDVRVDGPASGPSVSASGEVAVGEAAGVRVFTSGGAEKWRHVRAARVVGTRWIGDRVLAWGEDGVLERLGPSGEVELTFRTSAGNNPAPIYAAVMALDTGAFGVLDAAGTAHLVGPDGASLSTYALSAAPLREATIAPEGRMLVGVGNTVRMLQFVYTIEE